MNILYCGDRNIEKGLTMSVLSLSDHMDEPLHIYVLTAGFTWNGREYLPVTATCIGKLRDYLQAKDPENSAECFDVTELLLRQLPQANMGTRFTPCCMLRLYADLVPELPDKILYLDNDVLCRGDLGEFYHQDLTDYELAGCLDYYGRWFFHNDYTRLDYLNSGVLLLNLAKIRETGLFRRCVERCSNRKMFMPDQSALNKLATAKKIEPRKYNEQRKLQDDTVLQHFTTSFCAYPVLHPVKVKPWDQERLHRVLKIYEYDDLLDRARQIEEEGTNPNEQHMDSRLFYHQ